MSTPVTGHEFLLGAYDSLYRDIISWLPDLNRKALTWDLSHLRRLVESRGQRYITIDLPEFGKFFESSLASGTMDVCNVPGFGRVRYDRLDDRRPRLFWALLSRVFSPDCTLKSEPCHLSIFFVRQLCYLFKKLKGDCRDEYKFASIKEFFDTEAGIRPPSLDWEDPISTFVSDECPPVSFTDIVSSDDGSNRDEGLSDIDRGSRLLRLQQVCDILVGNLTEVVDPSALLGRHGPGSVSDAKFGTDKYRFPSWPDKLQSLFPFDWHASSNMMSDETFPLDRTVYSKLICVPKTHKGPRIIASEPICHQWVQQAVSKVILEALCKWKIPSAVCITDQSLNQRKAYRASKGNLATIDLSSASDRLSCHTVERVFRRNPGLLACMMACRTQLLINKVDKKFPSELLLKKFAMMGSALTFPVQTFVFLCVTISSILETRGLKSSLREISGLLDEVAVYGDDIVIPVDSVKELVTLMEELGLKVNLNKSFWTGKFRESCGTDWYDGSDVSCSHILSDFDPTRPGTASSVIEVSNNLYKNGLWNLSDYVTKRVPLKVRLRLPVEDGSISIKGLFSFMGVKVSHLKTRWNASLHRTEYRVSLLKGKIGNEYPDGFERLRRYFTEKPSPNIYWNPVLGAREVPVLRERYVPLFNSGI